MNEKPEITHVGAQQPQDDELWECSCGKVWGHICDEAEGCYWIPTENHNEEEPVSYNECLYCGEPVAAPALYCCEEHEEHRSLR